MSDDYLKNLLENSPICSYGIILYTITKTPTPQIKYLLCQRRDTIEYTDFLRGRYSQYNLKTYISLMTKDERERILNYSFSDLWYDLWVNHNTKLYKEIYPKAKVRFDANYNTVINLIKTTDSLVKEPIWGFPKGKPNVRESEIQTSIREFKEETKLNIDYKNIVNISPSIETFKGSNNKLYSTFYYIANIESMDSLEIKKIPLDGIRKETISEEISNLCWASYEEARLKLPPWRKKLLLETEVKIKKYLSIVI